jgi:hypothetical protein
LHTLEGSDEALEGFGLESAVSVGDEGPGQTEYAGVALERTFGKLWELTIEPGREVLPDLPGDLLDDVEVVDEPLSCRSDCAFLSDHGRDGAITLQQDAAAVSYAGREGASGHALGECALAGDDAGMLLESFGAEELSAYGVWGLRQERRRRRGRSHIP